MVNRELGKELSDEGLPIGRDPRRMSHADLTALGHKPMSAQDALRARCIDCCAGSVTEVRLCVSVSCPSWPFRMGKSPWKEKRILSDERKAQLATALAAGRAKQAGTV